ncbi:MAG TPA: DNA translocase FtsK 4TM domain-containing protein, partial [Candidatus Methylacidiphilales bacterium]
MPSSVGSHNLSWSKNLAQLPLFKQVIGFLWASLYIVTVLSLFSYDPADMGFNVTPPNPAPSNFIGYFGAGLAGILYIAFGFGAWFFPLLFIWCCLINFLGINIAWRWKPIWIFFFLLSGCSLLQLQHFGGWQLIQRLTYLNNPGGLVGEEVIRWTVPYALGSVGAGVLFGTVFTISTVYLFNINPVSTILNASSWYREWRIHREEERLANASPQEQLTARQQRIQKEIAELQKKAALEPLDEPAETEPPAPVPRANIRRPDDEGEKEELVTRALEPVSIPAPKPARVTRTPASSSAPPLVPTPSAVHPNYVLPSTQLLSAPAGKARDMGLSDKQLQTNIELII